MAKNLTKLILSGMLACAAAGLGSAPAFAWGKTGHRISGAIAERHLSGEARARIALLLGRENLADGSIWADDMRSDPALFWQKTASPWHYVTVPCHDYLDVHAPNEGDAFTALQQFRAIILDEKASREDKQLALRFIIHIVGDLHQPLHAGKPGDRGGNEVKVTFFGKDTNLHSVWDSAMIDNEQLSYTEYSDKLMRQTRDEEIIAWWESDPRVWIGESTRFRDQIYPSDPKLSYDYIYRHKPIVEQRLQQAGIRLAAYLNDLLSAAAAKPAAAAD